MHLVRGHSRATGSGARSASDGGRCDTTSSVPPPQQRLVRSRAASDGRRCTSTLSASPSPQQRLVRSRRAPNVATFAAASTSPPSPSSSSTVAVVVPSPPGSPAPPPMAMTADLEEAQERSLAQAMAAAAVTPGDLQSLLQELGVRYDPDALSRALAPQWAQLTARSATVAAGLSAFAAKLATDLALGRAGDPQQQAKRARELLALVSRLGPSFVKIGQALSARPDLLPRPYLEALAELQDRIPPFDDATAYSLIEQELGAPPSAIFSELSASPVAAASLGQVYKGVHRATGMTVAVKVQRPGIGEQVAVDMVLLRRLTRAIDAQRFVSQELTPLVDEFAARLFGELDYVQEGRNCERFKQTYGKIPRVSAPDVVWAATSRRVLTMSWVEGVKLTDVEGMARAGLSVLDFVDVGVQCTLEQMLGGGEQRVFHADPHPGNLLATTRDGGPGDLVYLDHGLVAQAPEAARYAILTHVVHLINRDYLAMTQDYYELDFMDRSVDTRPIAPALAAFFDDVLQSSVAQLNFKSLVDGLGDVLFAYPFRVPPYYALILRSLTVLEGLALQADPNYRLLARAYPYMAKRLLADPAPQLRATFEEMVVEPATGRGAAGGSGTGTGTRLRWSRLEGLLRAGAQSYDFDPSQLWLLAEWMLGGVSGGGGGSGASAELRASVAEEAARLLDSVAAAQARAQVEAALGREAALAAVPEQPGERVARERAELIFATVAGGGGGGGGGGVGVEEQGQEAAAASMQLSVPPGSGPFGMVVSPADAARVVQEAVGALVASAGGGEQGPEWARRAAALSRRPEAREMAAAIGRRLAQRAAARAVKLGFGVVDLATRRR